MLIWKHSTDAFSFLGGPSNSFFFLFLLTDHMSEGRARQLECLAAALVDHGHGLMDVAMASFNFLVQEELPRISVPPD